MMVDYTISLLFCCALALRWESNSLEFEDNGWKNEKLFQENKVKQ